MTDAERLRLYEATLWHIARSTTVWKHGPAWHMAIEELQASASMALTRGGFRRPEHEDARTRMIRETYVGE